MCVTSEAKLSVQQCLIFILPGWVYKCRCMVYEKCIILTEEDKKSRNEQHFVEKTKQIMQHILQMQQISLLPKYIK